MLKDLVAGLAVSTDKAGRMTIKDPYSRRPLVNAETEEPAWIDVLSDVSKVGAAFAREMTDKALGRRGRVTKAEELEDDLSQKAARLCVGWSLLTLAGEPIALPFTAGNARELFQMSEMAWLRDQVLEYAGDLGNFRATPSKPSSPTPDTSSASTDG